MKHRALNSASVAASALVLALALTGCTVNLGTSGGTGGGSNTNSSNQDSGGDIASDLTAYVSEITPLASEDEDILDRYGAVTGDNYTDDQTTYNALNALVPDTNKYISKLEAIHPTTATLQEIHAKYVDAWNKYSEAFQVSMSALESQDRATLAQANDLLAQARKLVIEWQNDLKALK